MGAADQCAGDTDAQSGWFVTTHWSVVLTSGQADSGASQVALETLCRTYWHPLYAFVRRQGYPAQDAQDLTQGFFLHLLESVLAKLKAEAAAAGKGAVFDALSGRLMGEDGGESYAEAGRRLNLTEAAVKMVVLRLRQRYRELLRLEISRTVETPEAVDAEITHLIAALRCPVEPP